METTSIALIIAGFYILFGTLTAEAMLTDAAAHGKTTVKERAACVFASITMWPVIWVGLVVVRWLEE